jgi:hypothetical protein
MAYPYRPNQMIRYGLGSSWERHDDRGDPSNGYASSANPHRKALRESVPCMAPRAAQPPSGLDSGAPVVILDPDDVVLAEVASRLNFDQLQ